MMATLPLVLTFTCSASARQTWLTALSSTAQAALTVPAGCGRRGTETCTCPFAADETLPMGPPLLVAARGLAPESFTHFARRPDTTVHFAPTSSASRLTASPGCGI